MAEAGVKELMWHVCSRAAKRFHVIDEHMHSLPTHDPAHMTLAFHPPSLVMTHCFYMHFSASKCTVELFLSVICFTIFAG